MDKLLILKDVVSGAYTMMLDDQRTELTLAMGELFRRPLIRFDEAYEDFVAQVTKSSDIFDRWLNIQLQVLTELGPDQEALQQLTNTFTQVLEGTPGGETATFDGTLFENKSFVIALAFRIYLDALVFKQTEQGAQQ
jgi:hypothetical protein